MPNQNEVALLRDQITEEVNRDAEVLGGQLFAGPANSREPDLQRVSDDNLKALYRQKYLDQDREWLTNEAQRDPQQFMKVAQAIGVVLPEQLPDHIPPANTLETPPGQPNAQIAPVTPPVAPPGMPMPPPGSGIDPAVASAVLQQMLAAQQQQQPAPALPGMIPQPVPAGPQPVILQLPPGML